MMEFNHFQVSICSSQVYWERFILERWNEERKYRLEDTNTERMKTKSILWNTYSSSQKECTATVMHS